MSLQTKKKIREDRVHILLGQIFELKEAGIEVFELTPYQYRLIKENKRIDFYPTSGKYCDLNSGEWGYVPTHKILTLFDLPC